MPERKLPFITFEGGEGIGKSTQIRLLQKALPKLYPHRSFVFTREPGGSLFAEMLRKHVIISDDPKIKETVGKVSNATMFALFTAARIDHVESVIKPALDAGKVVVSDRFDASSYAYQIWGDNSEKRQPLRNIFFAVREYLKPYLPRLTLILDSGDPKIGLARIRSRGEAITHFEERDLSFHQQLLSGYRAYAEFVAPDASRIIPVGNASMEEVHEMIMTHLRAFFE